MEDLARQTGEALPRGNLPPTGESRTVNKVNKYLQAYEPQKPGYEGHSIAFLHR
jgi:hypothetical protein